MENISPLETTWPQTSIPPRDDTVSRTPSQDYAAIPITEDHGHYEGTVASSTNSRRNSLCSENNHRATLEGVSLGVAVHSNVQAKHDTETHEAAISTTCSDENAQPRSCFQDLREIVVKFWLWEVAACVLSLVSLASIVGVLIYEDNKQLDQWAWSIPPTAVVSFIGTLGKASLVLVLSQVLSQLKWLHFRETKSLRHVRNFDGASRGPVGAVLVILHSKRILASIAACLMILTILIDPFIQLVFTFPNRLVESNAQSANFSRIYDWNIEFMVGSDGLLSPEIVTSISEGLTSTNTTITTICPSGNCVWSEPIKTLGVCGSCSNVTADVNVSCSSTSNHVAIEGGVWYTTILTCNYTYNDDYILQAHKYVGAQRDRPAPQNNTAHKYSEAWGYLGPVPPGSNASRTIWNSTTPFFSGDETITNTSFGAPTNKTMFELEGHPIIPQPSLDIIPIDNKINPISANPYSFTIIHLPPVGSSDVEHPEEMPAATCWNCEMHWCEKSFEAVRIIDNAPPVYTVATEALWFFENLSDLYGLPPGEFNTLNETIWNFRYRLVNASDLTTHFDGPIGNYFNGLFNSYYVGEYVNNSDLKMQKFWGDGNPSQADLTDNTEALLALVSSNDLNATFHRLIDSLSEAIRTGPNSTSVVGQNLVDKSFIHVRWAWLALPLALVATTSALLLIVAIKSHSNKVAIWKDDPLALLFHSVSGADILPGGDSKTGTSDLDNLADELYVRLDGDRPWKFAVSKKKA